MGLWWREETWGYVGGGREGGRKGEERERYADCVIFLLTHILTCSPLIPPSSVPPPLLPGGDRPGRCDEHAKDDGPPVSQRGEARHRRYSDARVHASQPPPDAR